jgi:hypothetical protein
MSDRRYRLAVAANTYHLFRPDDGKPLLGLDPHKLGTYITLRKIHYQNRFGAIDIPKGFSTDLASIPRWLHWFIEPTDPKMRMALVHDAMYALGAGYREDADMIFRSGLKADGVPAWKAWIMWLAVRWFGGPHWNGK